MGDTRLMCGIWDSGAGEHTMIITLFPVAQSPEIARVFVKHQLLSLGLPELIDNGCLVVSELVANVYEHVPTVQKFYLYLHENAGRPLLEVWDPSPRFPTLIAASAGESGRGLYIVNSLSAQWSYYALPPSRGGGKVVWARLR
jgi:anti-sigma regulatory factor (Ser/Thr protein kinase)